MEGIITNKIVFSMSPQAANQASTSPSTGDFFMWFFFILVIAAVIVFFAKFRKNNLNFKKQTSGNINPSQNLAFQSRSRIYIIPIILFIVACFFGILGFSLNASALNANNETDSSKLITKDTVHAYIDESAGSITIENSFIENKNSDCSVNITKTELISSENLGQAVWNIATEQCDVLYKDIANKSAENSLKIKSDESCVITYKVDNLDIDTAKTLVDKDTTYVNFHYKKNSPSTKVKGKVVVNQNESEKARRQINVNEQKVNFVSNDGMTASASIDDDGHYVLDEIPIGTTGVIDTSVVGCRSLDQSDSSHDGRKIYINEPITGPIVDMNFNLEGPEFDNYTLDELKIVSTDISDNSGSSKFYNEFTDYVKNDVIWWSNSNSKQAATCTSEDLSAIDYNLCNPDYKCNFKTLDTDEQKSGATINQFLFLRIIGIDTDNLSGREDGKCAGLTLQAISCLPNTYTYGYSNAQSPDDGWQPVRDFGRFWGDDACIIRSEMNNEQGSIFSALADSYKTNIVSVDKYSQRSHKWGKTDLDICKTSDKLFTLSYSEMCSPDTEYSAFKDYAWYDRNKEGTQYLWYKLNNINGSTNNHKLQQMAKLNNAYQIDLGFNPWTRTAYHKTDHNFLYIDSETGSIYKDVSYENNNSVVLAFCL